MREGYNHELSNNHSIIIKEIFFFFFGFNPVQYFKLCPKYRVDDKYNHNILVKGWEEGRKPLLNAATS